MALDGLAVFYATAGGVLLWSGVKGQTVTQTLHAITSGNAQALAASGPQAITSTAAAGAYPAAPTGAGTTNSGIANDALQYAGHPYLYGGAPGTDGSHPWDCSSFCNWVLNHDLGLPIPGYAGGAWPVTTHGPATGDYLLWSGAATVGTGSSGAAAAQPGDLCVWQTHMGIATGGGQMISALNESLGTRVTSIPGGAPGGELLFVRRVRAAPAAPPLALGHG